jgi:aryl-alcohol dehydrogenase-like predicted oxidoreductase
VALGVPVRFVVFMVVFVVMAKILHTDLDVFPLCLGGNVFGWTADERQSFEVLDAYAAAGGNFIDTADAYSSWVEGNSGGESETIIGNWMAARGNRDRMIVATKIGHDEGLAADVVREKAEASLRRLRTDRIDILFTHKDDLETPLEETMGALDGLVRAGKARHVAASNYSAPRLAEALAVSDREGLARFAVLQPHYNLVDRRYESELAPVVAANGLAAIPYYGLAAGFLSGKYRPGVEVDSARAPWVAKYLNDRGFAVLAALDEIAAARGVTLAAVALAWLAVQPTVAVPIASARTTGQLADLLPMVELDLTAAELEQLDAASSY